ncbi:hypothetical protein [uncultured Nitrospira sp.]|uniref:hypothetical protein n=1 Tax=uncultured Nitrospira sp. TaxID=157176 RepID=UPI0031408A24
MYSKWFQLLVIGLSVISTALAASPTHAWKIDTHIWLAKGLYEEIKQTGKVHLPIGEFPIPSDLQKAIANHEGAFLLGVLGPDTYPDMIAGQMTTHPGVESKNVFETAATLASMVGQPLFTNAASWQTDDWLLWIRTRALATSTKGPEVAFAYGYLIHAAMDMWAHTYVNLYAGDVFSLFDEQEVEFRHMAIESLVARTHKSYLPEPVSLTNEEAGQRLGGQLRGTTGNPQNVTKTQPDLLTPFQAPREFVRTNLVLNLTVANQYAREKATQHLFAMYVYWNELHKSSQPMQALRTAINNAANTATQALSQAQGLFNAAQSSHNTAVQAAGAAYDTMKKAEKAAGDAADQFAKARKNAFGLLDNITSQMVANLPPHFKGPYEAAKKARDNAIKAIEDRRNDYNNLVKIRDNKKNAMQQALETVNLRKTVQATLNQVRNQTLAAIDGGLTVWRQGIENAVDAYIQAWEDTSKELLRPPGSRFSPGHDVTEPLKQWTMCWGPTFGLPVLTQIAPQCDKARTGYIGVKNNLTNLKLLLQNTVIDQTLRNEIEKFDKFVAHTAGEVLAGVGKMVSTAIRIDKGALAGYSRSIVNLRSKDPAPLEVDDEFNDDTSRKQLVIFPQITQLLYQDMGLPLLAKNMTLDQLPNFAALQNSLTMAKLVLLDGQQLNTMIFPKTRQTPYPAGALAGEVLMGALRSIDGDHQWKKAAPQLPRRAKQPFKCRIFGYDQSNSAKGGLKLWQDETIRLQVFNTLFKGPLTPGLMAHMGAQNLGPGIGVAGTDPFPPTPPSSSGACPP